jgi:phospholipid/cholesterol/gamma-HCH transport system permease protein
MRPFGAVGRAAIRWICHLGASMIFLLLAVLKISRPKQLIKIVPQVCYIGARSSMIIMLVGFFTGMVPGLQSYRALVKFGDSRHPGGPIAGPGNAKIAAIPPLHLVTIFYSREKHSPKRDVIS